ncbi:MAG: hypothetical protein AAB505_02510 [Patescibacteria group bacterium]
MINQILLAVTAFAAEGGLLPELVPCKGKTQCDYNSFLLLVKNIFDFVTLIAAPLATLGIVWGGVLMVLGANNAAKRSQAISMIWTSVIGLVIVLASYLIVHTILGALVKPEFIKI